MHHVLRRASALVANTLHVYYDNLPLNRQSPESSNMQFVANKVQEAMGPEPSVVEAGYKARPGGETMRALAWFGYVASSSACLILPLSWYTFPLFDFAQKRGCQGD